MKIRRFPLKNVTSYRERVEFAFDDRLNILIGPNGGGKSNLQKAPGSRAQQLLYPSIRFQKRRQ